MDTKKVAEKRKFPRVNIPGSKVSFKLLDPRSWSTYHEKSLNSVENISIGGLALKTNTELALKSPIGVDIKLSPELEIIRTFGRVAWIKRNRASDNDFTMGISFSWWKKDEDKKVVYEAIKNNI